MAQLVQQLELVVRVDRHGERARRAWLVVLDANVGVGLTD
jgi:hypothetical protein